MGARQHTQIQISLCSSLMPKYCAGRYEVGINTQMPKENTFLSISKQASPYTVSKGLLSQDQYTV